MRKTVFLLVASLLASLRLPLAGHSLAPAVTTEESADPYLWLESESERQRAWLTEQQAATDRYFRSLCLREVLTARIEQICSYERISLPEGREGLLYYIKYQQPHNKAVLIEEKAGKQRILIDPGLSQEPLSLVQMSLSPDGRYLAYCYALAGSDQHRWHIFDVHKEITLPESLSGISFSTVSWHPTSACLYYIRNCKEVFAHCPGSPQKQDRLLFTQSGPFLLAQVHPVLEGTHLLLMERPGAVGTNRMRLFKPVDNTLVELIAPRENIEISFVGEANGCLFFLDDAGNGFGTLFALQQIRNAEQGREWRRRDLLTGNETTGPLQQVLLVGQHLVCLYYKHAIADLKLFDLQGKLIEKITLPKEGTVTLPSLLTFGKEGSSFFYSYADFSHPGRCFLYDVRARKQRLFFAPKLAFQPDSFVTERRWYYSLDGTKIPLFLVYRKDTKLGPETPILLYGYGGLGLSVTPHFRSLFLAWMEGGGAVALPNLRGGREFGRIWYEQGKKLQKQNVFDDCLAAADYLIQQKLTTASFLAIFGASNGGLLAGACLTQRPELFRAAIVNKGFLDMLRFHLFTVGKYCLSEYGDPAHPLEREYLRRYSPYHCLCSGTCYPSVLVNTADRDDRVVPLHSYKFAAALQATTSREPPSVFLRVEKDCGHGSNDSYAQETAFAVDALSFLYQEMDLLPRS